LYFARKTRLILRFYFSYFIGLINFDYQKNKLLIFNYHNFNNSININDEMYVSFDNFKKQLIFFKKKNLLISYNDFLNAKKNNLKKKKILITIDDADFSVTKIISTVNELKVPIILFLPIGLLLGDKDINYYRSLCLHNYYFSNSNDNIEKNKEDFFNKIMKSSIQNLKKINDDLHKKNENKDYVILRKKIEYSFFRDLSKNPYITLGAHSMSHVKLGKIPNNWLQWEINESLKYIKKLQGSIDIYALPYGNYDSFSYNVIRSLTMNKIKYIFSTIGLVNDYNNILLGRSFILNSDSVFYLKGLINGSMNLFEKLLFRVQNNSINHNKNKTDDIYPLW